MTPPVPGANSPFVDSQIIRSIKGVPSGSHTPFGSGDGVRFSGVIHQRRNDD